MSRSDWTDYSVYCWIRNRCQYVEEEGEKTAGFVATGPGWMMKPVKQSDNVNVCHTFWHTLTDLRVSSVTSRWGHSLCQNLTVCFCLKSISVEIMQFLLSRLYSGGCHDKESILNCNKWLQFIDGNGSHLSPAGQYTFEAWCRAL